MIVERYLTDVHTLTYISDIHITLFRNGHQQVYGDIRA